MGVAWGMHSAALWAVGSGVRSAVGSGVGNALGSEDGRGVGEVIGSGVGAALGGVVGSRCWRGQDVPWPRSSACSRVGRRWRRGGGRHRRWHRRRGGLSRVAGRPAGPLAWRAVMAPRWASRRRLAPRAGLIARLARPERGPGTLMPVASCDRTHIRPGADAGGAGWRRRRGWRVVVPVVAAVVHPCGWRW